MYEHPHCMNKTLMANKSVIFKHYCCLLTSRDGTSIKLFTEEFSFNLTNKCIPQTLVGELSEQVGEW